MIFTVLIEQYALQFSTVVIDQMILFCSNLFLIFNLNAVIVLL